MGMYIDRNISPYSSPLTLKLHSILQRERKLNTKEDNNTLENSYLHIVSPMRLKIDYDDEKFSFALNIA